MVPGISALLKGGLTTIQDVCSSWSQTPMHYNVVYLSVAVKGASEVALQAEHIKHSRYVNLEAKIPFCTGSSGDFRSFWTQGLCMFEQIRISYGPSVFRIQVPPFPHPKNICSSAKGQCNRSAGLQLQKIPCCKTTDNDH